MSDQKEQLGQADGISEPFLEFWKNYVQLADEVAKQQLASWGAVTNPLALSPARLDAVSRAMDVYLRSPEFLSAMRRQVTTIVAEQLRRGRAGERTDATATTGGCPESLDAVEQGSATSSLWDRFLELPVGAAGNARQLGASATPYDVVYEEGSLRLLRYRRESAARFAEPLLVCFSLVNRPYILDLQFDRSVIRHLLRAGLDVYLIDWGVPSEADHTLHLDDYICGRMQNVVEFLGEFTQTSQLNLMGYCMGGTMSAMFTALHPSRVRNLILLATPIDFSVGDGLLSVWTREEHFDVDALIDAFGNCPGWYLQLCFQQTKPIQNYVQKYLTLHERRHDDAFLENFFAVERWANDNIPVAGETFREFVKALYQQNLLVQGQLRLDGKPVELNAIACPVLILVAKLDHLVPPSSALALRNVVSSTDLEVMSIDAGHLGLVVSAKAHGRLWPKVTAWITERSTSR